jgi:alpha-glucosidase
LGLAESVLAFEDLRDPYGLAHYPDYAGRDGCRTPMPWHAGLPAAGFTTGKPWLPVDPAHLPLSIDRQERDAASPLAEWRRFLAWRKTHPALISGGMELIATPAPLIAFRRSTAEERLIAAINFSGETTLLPVALTAGSRPLEGHGFELIQGGGGLALPRYGMLFASETR